MKIRKTTRTTEITIEKSEFIVVHRTHRSASAWCVECGKHVRLINPEDAAIATGLNVREVYRRIEAGEVHFVETRDGAPLVCIKSL